MSGENYYFQVQDTIPKKGIQLKTDNGFGKTIDVGRNEIEIGALQTLRLDSTRVVKPKRIIPVKKTIPFVQKSDSIVQPEYNVFNNSFQFPKEKTLFDEFNNQPFDTLSLR